MRLYTEEDLKSGDYKIRLEYFRYHKFPDESFDDLIWIVRLAAFR